MDDDSAVEEFILSVREASKKDLSAAINGPIDIPFEGSSVKGMFRIETPPKADGASTTTLNDEVKISFCLDQARSDPMELMYIQELIKAVAVELGKIPNSGFTPIWSTIDGTSDVALVAYSEIGELNDVTRGFSDLLQRCLVRHVANRPLDTVSGLVRSTPLYAALSSMHSN
ncbi:hypothetical protein FOL47_007815 [Perkinsus chesapeaki]|uniref:Uncharacterized protein n=1 Tax=Perkinsus chesapeaki TaxID=330153 RepID=A0A7J6LHR0_PERCH|nr:hypothetical protein FOL47_007815 [Perkinsus chesapeaki]